MTAAPASTLAVVGFGTMGQGIAVAAASAGVAVRGFDRTEAIGPAEQALRARWQRLVAAGTASGDPDVTVTDDLGAALSGATVVIEAVPEHLPTKHAVLGDISATAAPDVLLATNTSSLPLDSLAGAVTGPERFAATHFFNPAELVPCVEVSAVPTTAAATVDGLTAFLTGIGKEPVVVQPAPGFIANRLQLALFLEALACVDEGLATPEQVDTVVRRSFGFRLPAYGPFQIADMAGLDVYASILDTLERTYGPRFGQPASLRALVGAGALGTKTGGGFKEYTEEQVEALLSERDGRYRNLLDAVD